MSRRGLVAHSCFPPRDVYPCATICGKTFDGPRRIKLPLACIRCFRILLRLSRDA